MNLRRLAQGKPCQIRLMSICDGGGETTCLAHVRRAGSGGTGLKPPDICGIWACKPCHDVLDGRAGSLRAHDSDVLDGLVRTLCAVDKAGAIK
jgi:hypothetical protein